VNVNTIFDRRLSLLLSLTTIAVLGSGLSAQAETKTPAPVPGTTATSAAVLTTQLPVTPKAAPASTTPDSRVAQDIDAGETIRGGYSYIGVAGNIGLSGGASSLGIGNIAVISKIGLTRNISVRPSAVFGDNTTVLIPLTYDFTLSPIGIFSTPIPISPYLGAGIAINTGNRSDTGALISAGVDIPLTPQFTATAGVNVGFINNTSVGLLIGIAYNLPGFGR